MDSLNGPNSESLSRSVKSHLSRDHPPFPNSHHGQSELLAAHARRHRAEYEDSSARSVLRHLSLRQRQRRAQRRQLSCVQVREDWVVDHRLLIHYAMEEMVGWNWMAML